MIQAIVVKGATSVRATVIANRTKSEEMGSSDDRKFENKTSKRHCPLHFYKEEWRTKGMLGNNATQPCKGQDKWQWRKQRELLHNSLL